MIKALFAISLVGALSGCVSILPEAPPAPRVFTLQTDPVSSRFAPLPIVLSVARPAAPRVLAGRDIPWRRGAELAFVDGAAWEGQTPEMLHALLLDRLDRETIARAVVRVADGSLADYEIRWDVLRFEVDESTPDQQTARIEATARLLNAATRTVVASVRVDDSAALEDRGARSAAQALTNAANGAVAKITQWAYQEISTDLRSQPSAASNSR